MKRDGILHPGLNHALSELGHGDRFAIADAGLPIPASIPRIDLVVTAGQPRLLDVLKPVLDSTVMEAAVIAEEIEQHNESEFLNHLLACLYQQDSISPTAITRLSHEQLKAELGDMRFIVRTGETTPFSNLILQSGVFFG